MRSRSGGWRGGGVDGGTEALPLSFCIGGDKSKAISHPLAPQPGPRHRHGSRTEHSRCTDERRKRGRKRRKIYARKRKGKQCDTVAETTHLSRYGGYKQSGETQKVSQKSLVYCIISGCNTTSPHQGTKKLNGCSPLHSFWALGCDIPASFGSSSYTRTKPAPRASV